MTLDTSNFKLINKSTLEIQRAEDLSRSTPNIAIRKNGRHFRFNSGAMTYCDMTIGKYLHFINPAPKIWYFIINDKTNGFRLSISGGVNKDAVISSKPLLDKFMKDTGAKYPDKFYIQKTSSKWNGYDLYEILTNKPVGKTGK